MTDQGTPTSDLIRLKPTIHLELTSTDQSQFNKDKSLPKHHFGQELVLPNLKLLDPKFRAQSQLQNTGRPNQ